jgi:p-aminobenzoyl-glutamate transporter AbgT
MKDNRDTIFQVITAIVFIAGFYFQNEYILLIAGTPVLVASWYWLHDKIITPINILENKTEELRKDLNTRKEIEDLKMEVTLLKSRRGGLNPFLFMVVLIIIAIIMLYLRDIGLI